MAREPILLRSVLHDREIEVALTMARIEPLSTQPGPFSTRAAGHEFGSDQGNSGRGRSALETARLTHLCHWTRRFSATHNAGRWLLLRVFPAGSRCGCGRCYGGCGYAFQVIVD